MGKIYNMNFKVRSVYCFVLH